MPLGMVRTSFAPVIIQIVPVLLFYNDGFGFRSPTKVAMLLNTEAKRN